MVQPERPMYEGLSRQTRTFNFTGIKKGSYRGGTTRSSKWQVRPITDRRRACHGPVQRPSTFSGLNNFFLILAHPVYIKCQ